MTEGLPSLNLRQQRFIEAYLTNGGNATEAARAAGYSAKSEGSLRATASRALTNVNLAAVLRERLRAQGMGPEEVLWRLGEHATASMADFLSVEGGLVRVDLVQARERGRLGLVKKLKITRYNITRPDGSSEESERVELELVDSQAALDKLARAQGLYKDQVRVSLEAPSLDDLLQARAEVG